MIFSIADHVEQIKNKDKTQTRRPSGIYKEGKEYAIQPGRGKHGIPDGKIRVINKRREYKSNIFHYPITAGEAHAEGGYTSDEYEGLYERMYPRWKVRYAYVFKFVPRSNGSET